MADKHDLDRIEKKIDKMSEDVVAIKVTLGAQHEVLKIHEKRSLTNEAALEIEKEHRIKYEARSKVIWGIIALLLSSELVVKLVEKWIK